MGFGWDQVVAIAMALGWDLLVPIAIGYRIRMGSDGLGWDAVVAIAIATPELCRLQILASAALTPHTIDYGLVSCCAVSCRLFSQANWHSPYSHHHIILESRLNGHRHPPPPPRHQYHPDNHHQTNLLHQPDPTSYIQALLWACRPKAKGPMECQRLVISLQSRYDVTRNFTDLLCSFTLLGPQQHRPYRNPPFVHSSIRP